jgi:hypothetical protein
MLTQRVIEVLARLLGAAFLATGVKLHVEQVLGGGRALGWLMMGSAFLVCWMLEERAAGQRLMRIIPMVALASLTLVFALGDPSFRGMVGAIVVAGAGAGGATAIARRPSSALRGAGRGGARERPTGRLERILAAAVAVLMCWASVALAWDTVATALTVLGVAAIVAFVGASAYDHWSPT